MKSKRNKNPVTSRTKKRKDVVTFEEILDYGRKLLKEKFKSHLSKKDFKSFPWKLEIIKEISKKFGGDDYISQASEALDTIMSEKGIIGLFDFNIDDFISFVNKYETPDERKEVLHKERDRIQALLDGLREFGIKLRQSKGFNIDDPEHYYIEHNLVGEIPIDEIRNIMEYCETQPFESFESFEPISLRRLVGMVEKEFKAYMESLKILLAVFVNLPELSDIRKDGTKTEPEKISIIGKKIDVVRIFEAMRKAKITSDNQGEIKKYGKIFTDVNFVDKYYSERRRLERDQSSSNSVEIIEFIKILCESSLKSKDPEIEKIITHLEHLQK